MSHRETHICNSLEEKGLQDPKSWLLQTSRIMLGATVFVMMLSMCEGTGFVVYMCDHTLPHNNSEFSSSPAWHPLKGFDVTQ